jgi:plasmid maintenance system antidote protein VapI
MATKKLDPVHPGEILLPPQFWLRLRMDYDTSSHLLHS